MITHRGVITSMIWLQIVCYWIMSIALVTKASRKKSKNIYQKCQQNTVPNYLRLKEEG